ncbi:30S ribosomal protein S6--L-glutamate ligase [Paraliomyxa miuraensis]|uniref:30S ribosomal protein S6--L-glutamate ligase n=1 Tax=Paraliomyxa miuraensis TaxID=376150 RepID=UPI002250DD46|nr:30S ribosomal protein S6--L-glutamate ligase [Paraliomyxa miuraensis]MCX4241399.1 30S ribosomal protein S6--L-glutamate ligase [Paraliomyxa miuraensis]
MKIGILTHDPSKYTIRRLVEAGESRGHEVACVDYSRCFMTITSREPQVLLEGEPLRFDAIIPRVGAAQNFYGTAVVRQFEMAGVISANGSLAIARARDKLRALQMLAGAGVPLPVTGFTRTSEDIGAAIRFVGGAPLIVKLLEGSQGVGVVLAETDKAAESVIAAFRQLEANILVQEFIEEAQGADLRAFVIDGKVVAAMIRQAAPGEFRSNLHRGGSAEKVKLSPEERSIAVRSAKVLGLRVAGVDILRSNHGPLVMEVNASPGLEGIEKATEKDVAGKIVEFVEELVRRGKSRAEG